MEIKRILTETICILSKNKISFMKNFLPFAITLLIIGTAGYVLEVGAKLSQETPEFGYIPVIFITVFVMLIILAKSIVHTHRTFILNENSSFGELFKFTKRDFRFIKKFIGLTLCMTILGIVMMFAFGKIFIGVAKGTEHEIVVFLLGLITTLIPAYVWSRLAIVLPSAAMEDSVTINSAWADSSSYSWTLFLGVGVIPVLTELIMSYIPSHESIIYSAGIGLLWIIITIIEIGILSITYKAITESKNSIV